MDQAATGETLTADEVRSFCHGQIAHNKIPRYVGSCVHRPTPPPTPLTPPPPRRISDDGAERSISSLCALRSMPKLGLKAANTS